MPLSRETLERQLKLAQEKLDKAESDLKSAGVPAGEVKDQPKWKKAKADFRAIKTRLGAVSAKEAITANAGSSSDEEE